MPLPHASWDDLTDLHRWYAEVHAPDPRPHLVAFAGPAALVLVGLRPFAPGGHHGPLIEALALALPLGADRVSVALPGRAWSLDDPVVPVGPDGDLRQRVVVQVTVDGHDTTDPTTTCRLHPFRVLHDLACGLAWDPPVDPGPAQGWVADALTTLVARRHHVGAGADAETVSHQADRLQQLGHQLLLARPVAGRAGP